MKIERFHTKHLFRTVTVCSTALLLLLLAIPGRAPAASGQEAGLPAQRGFGGPLYGQGTQQAEMNNSALKRSFSLGYPQQVELENMLAQHKFAALDTMFKSRIGVYRNDAQYESYVMAGFDQFSPHFKISEKDLDVWVETTGSATAYTARGVYKALQKLIANMWGSKYANGKPLTKDELEKVRLLDRSAIKDLQAALDKDPAYTPAYVWLIKTARGTDMQIDTQQLMTRLNKLDKQSFAARAEYMISLKPRWGGSYEKMAAYAREAITYADLNPRLWSLQGEVAADQGESFFAAGRCDAAIERYTAALQYGDRIEWLKKRAECYDRLQKKDWAAADYERVRFYDVYDRAIRYRSAHLKLSDLEFTLTDNSFIPPRNTGEGVRTIVVLPIDYHDDSLYRSQQEVQGVVRRNGDKIELMLMRLGYDCVERVKLEALLAEQRLSLTGLTEEKGKLVGKLINADAVVMTSIPFLGVDTAQGAVIENIDIKMVSVTTGRILWKSLLRGSTVAHSDSYNRQDIFDILETKLYDLLEAKLKNGSVN